MNMIIQKMIVVFALAKTMALAVDLPPETSAPFKPGEVVAFPGAEGAGKWTIGGRGGKVYEVTSLEDSGPGTFREACEAKDPRIVVFRKGGIIHLKDRLTITNPYITIAGQTAPGGGICIADRSFWINTHNVIVRYIRVRMGPGRRDQPGVITDDAFGGRPISDLIVDHVSASWGHDESLSFYKMDDANNDNKVPSTERVTVQWSIIGETMGHRFHPYGAVFGGKHADYHHNLFACNVSWEPYKEIERPNRPISLNPAPEDLNLINNVLFVWLNRGLEGGGKGAINVVNNYFVPDIDPYVLSKNKEFRIFNNIGSETGGQRCRYIDGNIVKGDAKVSADNWSNIPGDAGKAKSETPFKAFESVKIDDTEKAYKDVLEQAGATLPKRDKVDDRIVDATRNQKSYYLPIENPENDFNPFKGEGIIEFPNYEAGNAPTDSDHDGMPDEWELANGLDQKNADDGPKIKDGYSNLEWYQNALADGKTSIGTGHQYVNRPLGTLQSMLANLHMTSSKIRFTLERSCTLKFKLFDINGREHAVLFSGIMGAGYHEVDLRKNGISDGVWVVTVSSGKNHLATLHTPVN